MLMTKKRPLAIRTLQGWAMNVLQQAGAIHECLILHGQYGYTQDFPVELFRVGPASGACIGLGRNAGEHHRKLGRDREVHLGANRTDRCWARSCGSSSPYPSPVSRSAGCAP